VFLVLIFLVAFAPSLLPAGESAANLRAPISALPPAPLTNWDPTSAYEVRQVRGWQVLINRKLAADPELFPATLQLLDQQLLQITRAVPAEPLKKLRQIPIWIEHSSAQFPCMCYHESRAWLETHGVNPEKTGAVELANPTNFLHWTREQPWMVLHELAHGYHQRFLGENDRRIRDCYQRAVDSKIYESVLRINGRHERHYALNNVNEYFAEMTEAFFGTNDFYPFVRAELQEYDPAMYKALQDAWGVQH
jgi:hypothetical protein